MFKYLTALTALICISLAFPQAQESSTSSSKDVQATVISNTLSDDAAGNFAANYETSNSIKSDVKGSLKKLTSENGTETFGEVQEGSYSYVGDDGKTYAVKWVADENGKIIKVHIWTQKNQFLSFFCNSGFQPSGKRKIRSPQCGYVHLRKGSSRHRRKQEKP